MSDFAKYRSQNNIDNLTLTNLSIWIAKKPEKGQINFVNR